jgi:NADH:ubiquinone oxidoreductase subunit K
MLNAVNPTFVVVDRFSALWRTDHVFFVMTVAAAEPR